MEVGLGVVALFQAQPRQLWSWFLKGTYHPLVLRA